MKSKQRNNGFKFVCLPSATGPLIVPYKLERSPRVKRMHLQIHCSDFVILKMPLRHSELKGTRFLQEHGEWIRRTLAEQPRTPRLREYLSRHPRLSLNGRWYRLETVSTRERARYAVEEGTRQVRFFLNPRFALESQIIALLREIARERLPQRVAYWAGRHRIRVHGVRVRDQRCRWGSCSETGGISLNWRLILVSPRLQDHVILHELAHLRYFDHSSSFHAFLCRLDRRADQHARQLDEISAGIISLGRSDL